MKTHTIVLHCKEPDQFFFLAEKLELSDETRKRYIACNELARIELHIDERLMVVGGRFLEMAGDQDPLHPDSKCSCGGKRTCEWCQRHCAECGGGLVFSQGGRLCTACGRHTFEHLAT